MRQEAARESGRDVSLVLIIPGSAMNGNERVGLLDDDSTLQGIVL